MLNFCWPVALGTPCALTPTQHNSAQNKWLNYKDQCKSLHIPSKIPLATSDNAGSCNFSRKLWPGHWRNETRHVYKHRTTVGISVNGYSYRCTHCWTYVIRIKHNKSLALSLRLLLLVTTLSIRHGATLQYTDPKASFWISWIIHYVTFCAGFVAVVTAISFPEKYSHRTRAF